MNDSARAGTPFRTAGRFGGFAFFVLLSLIGFVRLLRQPFSGHYRIFTGAAKALWSGVNPHGTDFGTGVGYWFYSPTCGMFFFGPFSLLPERLGLALYMGFSWAVFVAGAIAFLEALSAEIYGKLSESDTNASKSLFSCFTREAVTRALAHNRVWFFAAPLMMSALIAAKLEAFSAGALMLVAAALIRNSASSLPFIPLAALVVLKFQPLPIAGLWLVSRIRSKTFRRDLFFLVFGIAFFFLLPSLFLGPAFSIEVLKSGKSTLADFSEKAWKDFDTIYAFFSRALGIDFSHAVWNAISAVFALGFAYLASRDAWGPSENREISGDKPVYGPIAFGLAAGVTFTTLYSPLNQNNAYILWVPALIVGFEGFSKGYRRVALVCAVIVVFAYSDLVPVAMRSALREIALKSCAVLGFAVLLACDYGRRLKDSSGALRNFFAS